MSDISSFNPEEKTFLAGAIKATILADQLIMEEELEDVERIIDILDFPDFGEYLEKFEASVKTKEEFFQMAKAMERKEVQSMVTQIMYDLALSEGTIGAPEEKLINELKEIWKSS